MSPRPTVHHFTSGWTMRLMLLCELKDGFERRDDDPWEIDSELLSRDEVDELTSGMRDAGHEVTLVPGLLRLLGRPGYWRKRVDFVVNRASGYRGAERVLHAPAALEALDFPFLGSTAYGHGLANHKLHAKLVVAAAGVDTPPGALVHGPHTKVPDIPFPVIVKPVGESASLGIDREHAVCSAHDVALARAKHVAETYRQAALVETFVRGLEIEVPVLGSPDGPIPLGAVALTAGGRLIDGDAFLDAESVYRNAYEFARPPENLDVAPVLRAATQVAKALGIRDYARIDFRVDASGRPWFMEANTLPHLQRHSSFAAVAEWRGLAYHEMLEEVLQAGLVRCGLFRT